MRKPRQGAGEPKEDYGGTRRTIVVLTNAGAIVDVYAPASGSLSVPLAEPGGTARTIGAGEKFEGMKGGSLGSGARPAALFAQHKALGGLARDAGSLGEHEHQIVGSGNIDAVHDACRDEDDAALFHRNVVPVLEGDRA